MKRYVAALSLGFLVFVSLNAQVVHDPNDAIYRDIDRWSVRGYILGSLPLIRPYPAQLIDEFYALTCPVCGTPTGNLVSGREFEVSYADLDIPDAG
jgi:hypothetical protein